jgi:hypothetical protein
MTHPDLIARWFDGLNRGDLPALLCLFAASTRIRNAANPPMQGPHAARELLEDFFQRTECRHFELIDAAAQDGELFAGWIATLVFRKGVSVAGRVLRDTITVELRGADWFKLDAAGCISELEIVHETASVARAVNKSA